MSFTWRMEVKDETFTDLRDHPSVGQDYITPDAGVASLDEFSVDGAGNCLEASFRASPKYVDIRARDIVSLEVSEDDGVSWVPVYRGYVVTAGNPRSDDLQGYKLVGLRQRFFEITNPIVSIGEDDIANQVESIITSLDLDNAFPAGVIELTPTIGSTIFPALNVTGPELFPLKESYGQTLQKIAEAAGRFVVEAGETYTYNGVDYTEGDIVPACSFGVDASGNIIFSRPQSPNAEFSEDAGDVIANYTQVTGEEIADTIELVYGRDTSTFDLMRLETYTAVRGSGSAFFNISVPNSTAVPLTRSFSFGDYKSVRQVNIQRPTALMDDTVELISSSPAIVNPTGSFSGGVTTFPVDGNSYNLVLGNPNGSTDGFICEMTIRSLDSNHDFLILFGDRDVTAFPSSDGSRLGYIASEVPDEGVFLQFVVLPAANTVDNSTYDVFFDDIASEVRIIAGSLELSDFRILVPDVDAGGTNSRQFASGFVRDVQQDVAEVTLVNQLGPVAPRMVWTPEGESPVTVPVERIQYTLTRNEGLLTKYELGQAFDAELLSERAVLKGLAREAVNE